MLNLQNISPSSLRALKTLLIYLWPSNEAGLKARIVGAMTLLIFSKAINVSVPIFYKKSIDALSNPTLSLVIVPIGFLIAYGVARILAQAFNELKDALFAKVSQRSIRTAGLETFRHLHQLSLRFHLDRKTGGLSRAIEKGIQAIDTILQFSMFNIVPTIIEILFVCCMLWTFYETIFMVLTLVTVIIYIWYTLAITEWRTTFVRDMNRVDSEANAKAIDSLLNYETVKYFGNETHEEQRFDASLKIFEKAAVKSKVSLSTLNIGQGIIIALGSSTIMILAAYRIIKGTMTLGDLVLVNAYLIQLYMPLNILGFAYRSIKMALVDIEQMFGFLEVKPEVSDQPAAPDLQISKGEIVFDDVSFGYNSDRIVLHNLSFTVPPGKTLAIVGSSGAGKSTISRLLFRFYDVKHGSIRIDGQDIRNVTQHSLRKAIGIVPQDTVLFNDTIFYNIAYGNPHATFEEVQKAARLAEIHSFISELPAGYDTAVGERGLKLSGGEKQRIAIARTILKNPLIFLFDEATSALDTHTEKAIQVQLKAMSANHTTLIIAHRLSTVIDADEIIVLDKGRIIERGTHQDLLKINSHYAKMWLRQQEAQEKQSSLLPIIENPILTS
ncbi:MAG: ABC transporter ATP-binding protein/permease [Alphaproteobacteria bacterium]|nr:ABC transporter ATP-binding protein/permease [Alphaproteobacteria bacterium]